MYVYIKYIFFLVLRLLSYRFLIRFLLNIIKNNFIWHSTSSSNIAKYVSS